MEVDQVTSRYSFWLQPFCDSVKKDFVHLSGQTVWMASVRVWHDSSFDTTAGTGQHLAWNTNYLWADISAWIELSMLTLFLKASVHESQNWCHTSTLRCSSQLHLISDKGIELNRYNYECIYGCFHAGCGLGLLEEVAWHTSWKSTLSRIQTMSPEISWLNSTFLGKKPFQQVHSLQVWHWLWL